MLREPQLLRFTNWAETYSCQPSAILEPRSEEDIIKVIRHASENRQKIRVVGAGHSPSDLVCTSGILLCLKHFNKLIKVDKDACLVTVQAGMTLHELNRILDRHGFAMPNLGSISDQHVGGLISTGTHGTGVDFGILSTLVTSITLITGTCEKHVLTPSNDPTLFSFAQCSLGFLGVMTEIQFKVEPHFNLKVVQRPALFNHMIEQWHTWATSEEHVRFWWFPHTEHVVVWGASRTDEPLNPAPKTPIKTHLLGVHLYELSLYISSVFPSLLSTIHHRYFSRFFSSPITYVDNSVAAFNFDCLFKQYVNEWAIPIEHGPAALMDLKQLIEDLKVPAHAPIEIRFTAPDDIPLSPSFQRASVYIGIIMFRPYKKDIPKTSLWSGFERIMKRYQGRPHWAKSFDADNTYLQSVYPHLEAWKETCRMWDPAGVFVNEYWERHFEKVREGEGKMSAKL